MIFYKYRTNWSSNPGTWDFVRLPGGETAKSFFDEMGREWDWSEHFRGIEYRKVKKPSKDWLQKQIVQMQNGIAWRKRLIEEYEQMYKTSKV